MRGAGIDGVLLSRQTSPEFRALWEDQTVGGLTRMFKVFVHPEVGRVELTYQTFDVYAPGQQLRTPEPGSRSAECHRLPGFPTHH
jgi:hypothetical protein